MNLLEQKSKTPHIPVLLKEVLQNVSFEDRDLAHSNVAQFHDFSGRTILDCTFGAGGYSRAFLQAGAKVTAIDRDETAIELGHNLQREYPQKLSLINARFSQIGQLDLEPMDVIVMDIGVSSMQLDQAERGFSFQKEGKLDMRMGKTELSAADIVNNYSEAELAEIFWRYGEEKRSRALAKEIVKLRSLRPFTTTTQLANMVENLYPQRFFEKKHPATKIFQALRIAVNDELQELQQALIASVNILKPEGRLAVVSFHSLEDRIVKQFFAKNCFSPAISRYEPSCGDFKATFKLKTKGAIKASEEEIAINSRARSARLRVAIKI